MENTFTFAPNTSSTLENKVLIQQASSVTKRLSSINNVEEAATLVLQSIKDTTKKLAELPQDIVDIRQSLAFLEQVPEVESCTVLKMITGQDEEACESVLMNEDLGPHLKTYMLHHLIQHGEFSTNEVFVVYVKLSKLLMKPTGHPDGFVLPPLHLYLAYCPSLQTYRPTLLSDDPTIGYSSEALPHPHWISRCSPCLGDFSTPIHEAINAHDLGLAILTYIEFLTQFYPSDCAGKFGALFSRELSNNSEGSSFSSEPLPNFCERDPENNVSDSGYDLIDGLSNHIVSEGNFYKNELFPKAAHPVFFTFKNYAT